MKFFLDENLPLSLEESIKKLGFEVKHARTVGLNGATDKTIANYAKKKESILITKDLEFGNLIIYPKNSHYGLIILRLSHNLTTEKITKILKEFLTKIDIQKLVNSIIILELGSYRIRKLN